MAWHQVGAKPFADIMLIIILLVKDSLHLVGLILGLHPANERRRYKVTSSLIGLAQT